MFFEVFLGVCDGRLSKIDFGTKVLVVQAAVALVGVLGVGGVGWIVTRILTW